jgi:DNA helicase-2/ATP-dependent DNA helicase PcrA
MPLRDHNTGLVREKVTRGFLRAGEHGGANGFWLGNFYHLFVGYVMQSGLDDEEDDDVLCPLGLVPIMTMHQSKGLEFPFVFVGNMNEKPKVQASHKLETLFSNYPANPARNFVRISEQERAEMDLIRQYYVAYSRAKYALILLGTVSQLKGEGIPTGPTKMWMRHRTKLL